MLEVVVGAMLYAAGKGWEETLILPSIIHKNCSDFPGFSPTIIDESGDYPCKYTSPMWENEIGYLSRCFSAFAVGVFTERCKVAVDALARCKRLCSPAHVQIILRGLNALHGAAEHFLLGATQRPACEEIIVWSLIGLLSSPVHHSLARLVVLRLLMTGALNEESLR